MALSGLKKRLKLGGGKLPSEINLINEIERELKPLSDADLKNDSVKLRDLLRGGENLDKSLPRALSTMARLRMTPSGKCQKRRGRKLTKSVILKVLSRLKKIFLGRFRGAKRTRRI